MYSFVTAFIAEVLNQITSNKLKVYNNVYRAMGSDERIGDVTLRLQLGDQ